MTADRSGETEPKILVERNGPTTRVTLNRPEKLNALDPEMMIRLANLWDELANDPSVRVVILTAAGDRAFCTGGDLGKLGPLLTGARQPEDEWDEQVLADPSILLRAILRDAMFPKPIVAAINGFSLAAGVEFMLCTDLRIATPESTFGLFEVRRGFIPAGGALSLLHRQIGWAAAMELVLLGQPISAERALEIGLLNRIVERDQLQSAADEWAAIMCENGPLSLQHAKRTMLATTGRPLDESFEIENEAAAIIGRTADAKEGPRAFMEKRKPNFIGE